MRTSPNPAFTRRLHQAGPFQPVWRFPPGPVGSSSLPSPHPYTFLLAPASCPQQPGPLKGWWGLAEGAVHDPKRKGPSLGPNAGGVSLDRRRLGTTAGTGDKVTYQSRFGAHAATPRRTGSAELFKRPYRLLYLSRRKASCGETKDVPYLAIQGHSRPHTAEGCTGDARLGRGGSRETQRRAHTWVCRDRLWGRVGGGGATRPFHRIIVCAL